MTDAESLARQMLELQTLVGSSSYPTDEAWTRELAAQCYERGYDLHAIQRQTAAIAAAGDRRTALSTLDIPTLVIHGEADQLIRLRAGRETANSIPGAKFVDIPGMGHDLPRQVWPTIIDEIHSLSQRACERLGAEAKKSTLDHLTGPPLLA